MHSAYVFAIGVVASHFWGAFAAETNEWTKPADGKWHEMARSLGKLPDATQWIEITNTGTKTVEIDVVTAESHPNSLKIEHLFVTGENRLLLQAPGDRSLVVDPGTNAWAGVELSQGGTLVNRGMNLEVGGENAGLLRINGGKLFQEGGSVFATTTYIYGGGEYHLTNGVLEPGYLIFPTDGGSFFQYGGTVGAEAMQIDLSRYSLQGGELHVRSSLRLRDDGSVSQSGGTNRVPELIVAANSSGGAEYLLTGGLLVTSNVLVGAFMTSSEMIQDGGEHVIANKLTVSGSARYYPPVPIPARYALTNGSLSARELELRGIGGYSEFIVAGGAASFAEKIQLNLADTQGIGGIRGLVKLENGSLAAAGISHAGVGADIVQTGGALAVSNLFSFGGFVPPPYDYGSPARKWALYDLRGGTFSAKDIELLGEWNIGSTAVEGRIANAGLFKMAGTLRVGDAREQFGHLVLSSNALIDLGAGHAKITFASSSSLAWHSEAILIITNWSGLRTGNGDDQVRFGESAAGISAQHQKQIRFANPAGDSPGEYAAVVLDSGEIVPAAELYIAPTVTITAPVAESSFLAPATVEIKGEVEVPDGEWFALRVHKLPIAGGSKRRTDAVHIATIETNRFSLILTNLPADRYEYDFSLSTLSDSTAATNMVSFTVTNFAFRLGPYAVTDLGTLGGTQTMAFAINNRGQVVGKARNGSDHDRAVLFENGTVRDLGTLGGAASRAYGINNNGDVVGSAEKVGGLSVPFVYRGGQIEDLGFSEAGDALDINDGGDIVGNSGSGFAILGGVKSTLGFRVSDINNRRQVAGEANRPIIEDLEIYAPFVDDPTENGYIAAKIYAGGGAYAINEARQFTGWVEDGSHREYRVFAPLYSQGNLQIVTGGTYSAGLGINRWGEVVGSYLPRWTGMYLGRPSPQPPTQEELNDKEAFIANPKGVVNLNNLIPADAGWVLLEATDINDLGQVVGFGKKDGEVRAFRLDPLLNMANLQRDGNKTAGTLQAVPGATVRIEATTDFEEWRAVKTETATGYEIPFTDQTGEKGVYYRAVVPES